MTSNLSYPLQLTDIDALWQTGLEATVTTRDPAIVSLLLQLGVVVTWGGREYRVTHVSVDRETETLAVHNLSGVVDETTFKQFALHLTAELQL